MSSYKLTIKSVGKLNLNLLKQNWLLWLFYIAAAVVTVITQSEEVLLFVAAGLIYMFVKAPPQWIKTTNSQHSMFLGISGFSQLEWNLLGKIGWFFTKAVHLFSVVDWPLFPFCMQVLW
jgi:chromate transporter